jgi:SWI/SNF-related matrix-associated actin-dependent regulator 1 of chromatin subfamily A
MRLFTYQVEGAKFLAEKGRALLADDMGLGKSAQAIRACDALDAKDVTVICPASVVENWRREFARFGEVEREVQIWSYDMASRGAADRFFSEADVLVLDESHYLKNHKAKRTKAIFGPKCDGKGGLVERAKHVFCLTGTPTPNNPSELWPMLRAVNGEPLSYWRFVQRYCRTRDNGFDIQIVGGKNLAELKERIAPFVLRRKKEDVLKDLPPIRFDELPLQCDRLPESDMAQMDGWDLIVNTLAKDGVEGLREIAPHVAQLRRLTGLAKVPAAIEWIKEQFEGGLKKLVVFVHHLDVMRALCVTNIGFACIHGGTTDRQAQVDRFQNDPECKLFIGQIQAAGTGITLTAASDVLFVEQDWTPGNNLQAAMRIHRLGQRNACLVRVATLAGSIDEQIQRALLRKFKDIETLFN